MNGYTLPSDVHGEAGQGLFLETIMFTADYFSVRVETSDDYAGVYDGDVWFGNCAKDSHVCTRVRLFAKTKLRRKVSIRCPECHKYIPMNVCYQHFMTHDLLREIEKRDHESVIKQEYEKQRVIEKSKPIYAIDHKNELREHYSGFRPCIHWGFVIPSGNIFGRMGRVRFTGSMVTQHEMFQCSRCLQWFKRGVFINEWKHHVNANDCCEADAYKKNYISLKAVGFWVVIIIISMIGFQYLAKSLSYKYNVAEEMRACKYCGEHFPQSQLKDHVLREEYDYLQRQPDYIHKHVNS